MPQKGFKVLGRYIERKYLKIFSKTTILQFLRLQASLIDNIFVINKAVPTVQGPKKGSKFKRYIKNIVKKSASR